MKFQGFIAMFVILCTMISGCEPPKKERPSPLRADSTVVGETKIKIEFSSPSVQNRAIWGGLVAYDRLWRTGANEATVFSSTGQVKLAGNTIESGKYALFTIPTAKEWTLILNENWNQWGIYNYDSTHDVLRINIQPKELKDFSERMRFYFKDDSLKFHWANLGFSLDLE